MTTHLDKLQRHIGPLVGKKVLDLGAGDGDFLMQCVRQGISAIGIEFSQEKITIAHEKARVADVPIDIRKGIAEQVQLPSHSFDFINASELIEHVQNPSAVLREVARLMVDGGACYMSVHNRYGMTDRHFKMRFLGWMPRSWAERYIVFRGINKRDYDGRFGMQRLHEMHYYTWKSFSAVAAVQGLTVVDLREALLRRRTGGGFLAFVYRILVRPLYLSTFHVLLVRNGDNFRNQKDTEHYNLESAHYSEKRYPDRASNYSQYFFLRRQRLVLNAIRKWAGKKEGISVLEIGCADGVVVRSIEDSLGSAVEKITGIDIAQRMIERARKLTSSKKVVFYLRGTEPNNNRYDVVLEVGVINFTDFTGELAYAHRQLKKNGLFVVSVAGRSSTHVQLSDVRGQYVHLLSYDDYERMLRSCFSIRKRFSCGLHLPILWRVPAIARYLQPFFESVFSFFPALYNEQVYLLEPKPQSR